MALVNGVLSIFEDDLLSVLRCPETSGICQSSDVTKSHMILRQSTTTGQYWKIFEKGVYDLPDYWDECLLPYFRQSGVSAAFTLRRLISKSFTVKIVKKGVSFMNLYPIFHTYYVCLFYSLQEIFLHAMDYT